jgi:hypothetical protein
MMDAGAMKCWNWIFPKKIDTAKRKISISVFHNQPGIHCPELNVFLRG